MSESLTLLLSQLSAKLRETQAEVPSDHRYDPAPPWSLTGEQVLVYTYRPLNPGHLHYEPGVTPQETDKQFVEDFKLAIFLFNNSAAHLKAKILDALNEENLSELISYIEADEHKYYANYFSVADAICHGIARSPKLSYLLFKNDAALACALLEKCPQASIDIMEAVRNFNPKTDLSVINEDHQISLASLMIFKSKYHRFNSLLYFIMRETEEAILENLTRTYDGSRMISVYLLSDTLSKANYGIIFPALLTTHEGLALLETNDNALIHKNYTHWHHHFSGKSIDEILKSVENVLNAAAKNRKKEGNSERIDKKGILEKAKSILEKFRTSPSPEVKQVTNSGPPEKPKGLES